MVVFPSPGVHFPEVGTAVSDPGSADAGHTTGDGIPLRSDQGIVDVSTADEPIHGCADGPSDVLAEALFLGGLGLGDVYITSLVKVRLPGNRAPTQGEVERWLPEFVGEGQRVDPTYTLILGRAAFGGLFPRTLAQAGELSLLRGRSWERGGRVFMTTWDPNIALSDAQRDEFMIDVATFARQVARSKEADKKVVIPLRANSKPVTFPSPSW
jgi:uracil-DNA glycosylase family 4